MNVHNSWIYPSPQTLALLDASLPDKVESQGKKKSGSMWIISFWVLPVISAVVWLVMLIAMISTWAAQGKPHYPEMSPSEHVP
jgi:flagellar basal body-associated protein FliL